MTPERQTADCEKWFGPIIHLASKRGPEKSICPSEVIRQQGAGGDWRLEMPAVREAARLLSAKGQVDILQKGVRLEPEALGGVKGPIRIRIRRSAT